MTKSLAAIPVAVGVALLGALHPVSQSRDLWIGVVAYSDPYSELMKSSPIDSSIGLEPIAALVGGRWWFRTHDNDVEMAIEATVGKIPAQWLPVGTELPSVWQAHRFNARNVTLRTSGPLSRARDDFELVVKTDLEIAREGKDTDYDPKGVAAAGDVNVRLFADLPASAHGELLRFLAPAMLAAERAEIGKRAGGAKGVEGAFPDDADTKRILNQLTTARFETYIAKTAMTSRDSVYIIEGSKSLATGHRDVPIVSIHTGAGARQDRSGKLHLLGSWSYLNSNENAHGNQPLAVLERNGVSCWLIGHALEGGTQYVLTRPGQIDPDGFAFTCDIK